MPQNLPHLRAVVDRRDKPALDGVPNGGHPVSIVASHFPLTVRQDRLDLYPADEMPLPSARPERGHTDRDQTTDSNASASSVGLDSITSWLESISMTRVGLSG